MTYLGAGYEVRTKSGFFWEGGFFYLEDII